MQRFYVIWRVDGDWLDGREHLPRLPFAYIRRAKTKPPRIPDYQCHAIVYDSDRAFVDIRKGFEGACHLVRVVKHGTVTTAEWARLQREPGAVMVWPNSRKG